MSTFTSRGRSRVALLAVFAMLAGLMAIAAPASAANGDVDNQESEATYSACVDGATAAAGFTDVADAAWYADAVDCMKYYGITAGKTATTYAPGEVIPRWQMAIFLAHVADLGGATLSSGATGPFTDLDGLSDVAKTAINQIYDLGVTAGKTATTFAPNDPVTRWQMAIFINTLLSELKAGPGGSADSDGYVAADGSDTSPFTDLGSVTSTALNAIEDVYDLGVTAGYGTKTTFAPFRNVTRAEMAVFLMAAMGHTNIRPAGVSLQASAGSGTTWNLVASYRNADFEPVANVRLDIFEQSWDTGTTPDSPLLTNGECDTTEVAPTQGASLCTIANDDPITNTMGNYPTTDTVAYGDTQTWWAWTGAAGDEFDSDNVTPASVTVSEGAQIDAVDISWNLPKYAEVDEGYTTAKFGTVTYSFQIVDAAGNALARSGEEINYSYDLSYDSTTESKSNLVLKTDASGAATLSFSVSDPHTASGDEATLSISFSYGPGVEYDMTDEDVWMTDAPAEATTVKVSSANDYVVASSTGAGAGNSVTATVYDQYGYGKGGESVEFTTDGTNSTAAATLFTGSDGTVTNAYAKDSAASEKETVEASVALVDSDSVVVYWVNTPTGDYADFADWTADPTNVDGDAYPVLGGSVVVDDDANAKFVVEVVQDIDDANNASGATMDYIVYSYDSNDQLTINGSPYLFDDFQDVKIKGYDVLDVDVNTGASIFVLAD